MKIFNIIFISFLSFNQVNAQGTAKQWVLGMNFSAVEDDGKPSSLFDVSKGWNALPFPTSFSFENYIKQNISLELHESINSYQIGRTIDETVLTSNKFFMSLDLNGKFHFNSLYKKIYWFDPFIFAGFGVTLRGKNVVPTGNIGFGSTFWIGKRVGVNIESAAKFSFSKLGTNYLQHSLGVKIKF